MAPKTKKAPAKAARKTAAKPAAAVENGAADKAAASKAAAEAAEAKRIARQETDAKDQAEVVKRVLHGDEKLSAVATSLNITSGKAAFLIMLHRVAEDEVPTIEGKDDEALLRAISKARKVADEYSSWGWLAARSGKSEGWIKSGLEELGLYEARAENIATKRSELKPAPTKAEKAEAGKGKTSKKKTVRGNG